MAANLLATTAAIRHDMPNLQVRWILSIGLLAVLVLASLPALAEGRRGGAAEGVVLPEGPPELRGETIQRIQKNRQRSIEKSQQGRDDAMQPSDNSNDASRNGYGETETRNKYRLGR